MAITTQPYLKLDSGVSSLVSSSYVEILAEGIYDDTTGSLCMVGCRKLVLDSQLSMDDDSVDCEILANIQFSPRNSENNSGYLKESIQSTRKKSDPLHFDRLELSSNGPLCKCAV